MTPTRKTPASRGRGRVAPIIFGWVSLAATTLSPACATAPKPAAEVPAEPATSSSRLTDEPPAPVAPREADARLVRCGVDDAPTNILGAVGVDAGGLLEENVTSDAFQSLFSMPAHAALGGRALPPLVAFKMEMPAPLRRKPQPGAPPLAAPVLRATLVPTTASLPAGTRAPNDEERQAIVQRTFDVSACGDAFTDRVGTVDLRLRVASSGAPVDVFIERSRGSDGAGTPIGESVTRCVAEIGCHLTLPPSAAGEGTRQFSLQATLAQAPSVFLGSSSVGVVDPSGPRPFSVESRQKIELALAPIAKACLEKGPPAASMQIPLAIRVDSSRHPALLPSSLLGAAAAFATCFGPQLETVAPVFAPARGRVINLVVQANVSAR
jgi:hypothetical protein